MQIVNSNYLFFLLIKHHNRTEWYFRWTPFFKKTAFQRTVLIKGLQGHNFICSLDFTFNINTSQKLLHIKC